MLHAHVHVHVSTSTSVHALLYAALANLYFSPVYHMWNDNGRPSVILRHPDAGARGPRHPRDYPRLLQCYTGVNRNAKPTRCCVCKLASRAVSMRPVRSLPRFWGSRRLPRFGLRCGRSIAPPCSPAIPTCFPHPPSIPPELEPEPGVELEMEPEAEPLPERTLQVEMPLLLNPFPSRFRFE